MRMTLIILFLGILVLSLSNCYTYDAYILEPINESRINNEYLGFSAIQPTLFISFFHNSNYPIEDIEMLNIFIKTGDINIDYNPINLRYERKLILINQNIEDKESHYLYETAFVYFIDRYVGERIKDENIMEFNIFIEYNILTNNEIVQEIIEQSYNIKIKKSIGRIDF